VIGVCFSFVFNAEVVDDEGELDGAPGVFPEALHEGGLVVAVFRQTFGEKVVGELAGLGQAVHAFVDADVYVAIVGEGLEVVRIYDFLWDEDKGNAHVFGSVHGRVEVEVFYVEAHVLGFRSGLIAFSVAFGQNAVPKEFCGCESCGAGADVTGIVNEVAADGVSFVLSLFFGVDGG
jgi:hypothetical protein